MEAGAWPWWWRPVRAAATLLAGVALALVLAHWGWQWWGPAPTPLIPMTGSAGGATAAITATPWFGTKAPGSDAAVTTAATDTASLQGTGRLLGLISGEGGEGYALFRLADRGPVLVRTGQEIAPGVTLEAVTAGGIRLRDRGELREMALRPIAAAPASSNRGQLTTARSLAASKARMSTACTPPGGGGAPVYRLNAELLTGIAAKPESWGSAFATSNAGLAVREGNAFAAMLGMKPGDRVTQANGVALSGTDDVLIAVIKPLLASQAVRVAGTRDGKPAEWIFVNAGACPA